MRSRDNTSRPWCCCQPLNLFASLCLALPRSASLSVPFFSPLRDERREADQRETWQLKDLYPQPRLKSEHGVTGPRLQQGLVDATHPHSHTHTRTQTLCKCKDRKVRDIFCVYKHTTEEKRCSFVPTSRGGELLGKRLCVSPRLAYRWAPVGCYKPSLTCGLTGALAFGSCICVSAEQPKHSNKPINESLKTQRVLAAVVALVC